MYAALSGVIEANTSLDGARLVVNRTLGHFPVDGKDIEVVGRGEAVASRLPPREGDPRNISPLRLWSPRTPQPAHIVPGIVTGRVVGGGVNLDPSGRVLPWISVLVEEERIRGSTRPLVIHALLFSPTDSRAFPDEGAGMGTLIPTLFKALKERAIFGGYADVHLVGGAYPHYLVRDATPDTGVGLAFLESGVRSSQFGGHGA